MQTKDDGTHVILPVADHLAVSLDHARLPVMMLRQSDGKMRRDGSSPARPQPSQPVGERGGLHGAPQLFAVVAWRIATKGRMAFSDKEERRRWRSRSESSHRLGRQDKARFLAPGTSFLSVCLHVVLSLRSWRPSEVRVPPLKRFAVLIQRSGRRRGLQVA